MPCDLLQSPITLRVSAAPAAVEEASSAEQQYKQDNDDECVGVHRSGVVSDLHVNVYARVP